MKGGVGLGRRRPGWVWAGLAVVVVSAVGFAAVVSAAGERETVLAVARDLPAGHVVARGDLRKVRVAADSGVMPAARARWVLGRLTTVPVVAGSLLVPGQLGEVSRYPPLGKSEVSVPVEVGGAPPKLVKGERVALVPGPSGLDGSAAGSDEKLSEVVVGVVSGVKKAETASGTVVVTFLVPTPAVRRVVAMEHPHVVVLPAVGGEAP